LTLAGAIRRVERYELTPTQAASVSAMNATLQGGQIPWVAGGGSSGSGAVPYVPSACWTRWHQAHWRRTTAWRRIGWMTNAGTGFPSTDKQAFHG
jgi:hypothetical protein